MSVARVTWAAAGLVALLLTGSPAPPARAAAAGALFFKSEAVGKAFSAWSANGGTPGCAFGIVKDGRLAAVGGYGLANIEHRIGIGDDTNFDLGSTSKQFTAAVLALLASDGTLSLDDDVRTYIPELPEYGRPITLRDLMNHTSGLRDYTDLLSLAGHREEDLTTSADALAMLVRQKRLNFPTGTAYRYCNSGYFLLSIVVQRVTGKSLRAVAAERLFKPLGMTGTTYLDDHAQIVPRRATGYKTINPRQFATAMSDWEQVGDGGVQTSIEDMAKWAAMFDQSPSTSTFPSAWLRTTLETPGRLNDGTELAYALGLAFERHRGLRVVEHGGSWAGYRAMLMRFPEKRLATIVLCNVAEADTHSLAYAVADAVFDTSGPQADGTPGRPPGEPATGRRAVEELGRYYNESLGEILTVDQKEGSILIKEIDAEAPFRQTVAQTWVHADPGGDSVVRFADDGGSLEIRDDSAVDPRPVTYLRARGARLPVDMLEGIEGTYWSDEVKAAWRVSRKGTTVTVPLPNDGGFGMQPLAEDLFTSDQGLIRLRRNARMQPVSLSLTNRGVVDLTFTRVADDTLCR